MMRSVFKKIKFGWQLFAQMGPRYVLFRLKYEFLRRTGLLEKQYPTNPAARTFISLYDWRKLEKPVFLFEKKENLCLPKSPTEKLGKLVEGMKQGRFPFFNAFEIDLTENYDWLTNPDTGKKFPLVHWTKVPDFDPALGDIKFVWEKARFSWLHPVIRRDYHGGEDQSAFVFDEILDFIEKNPINQGPNWRCSQEISLRVFNWTFALHYYKDSEAITEARFQKILHTIYWSLHHVRANIDFSRIAVRNNHAITETAMLFLSDILFPFFPESKNWSRDGRRYFEQEIAYQIYADGSFLQFSMNYHRVVVQVLSWVLPLAKANGLKLDPVVEERAMASLKFLRVCQDDISGQLPNYGQNDGALFFPMNDCGYRDFRPQLQALASYFDLDLGYEEGPWQEDRHWLGFSQKPTIAFEIHENQPYSFDIGGYYVLREPGVLTFIRCGNHRDRPSQADNLHLDIWIDGENVLRDAGTYKYNVGWETGRLFQGTAAHNTCTLGDFDQMEKGPRFVWLNWSQKIKAGWTKKDASWVFDGSISAFRQIDESIIHHRIIEKNMGKNCWFVSDSMDEKPATKALDLKQYWHPKWSAKTKLTFKNQLLKTDTTGWFSGHYGIKERSDSFFYESKNKQIETIIEA